MCSQLSPCTLPSHCVQGRASSLGPVPSYKGATIIRGPLTSLLLTITAVLLWVGAISLWTPSAPELLAVPTARGAPPTEHVTDASGYGLARDEGLFAVLADEDAAGDELLSKAGLLVRVLVLSILVGSILRELLASYVGCLRRAKSCLLVECCFHCVVRCRQGRPVGVLLAVFRL
jgi:hypothetical protein